MGNERITEEQKQKAIEAAEERGTMAEAAKAAGVCTKTLEREMKRSAKFKKELEAARKKGKEFIGETALGNIRDCAFGESEMDRTQLTANIALANAYQEGFRQKIEHKIEGDIRIITGVPRPPKQEKNK